MVAQHSIADSVLNEAAFRDFRRAFAGQVLTPTDAGYEEARQVWNGAIDRRPALIARCTSVNEVVQAVAFARANNVLIAVRGGGHNVAGTAVCDGGIVIDLSPMKAVRIDSAARRAWAQPGVLWGEFDQATQAFGLATTGGVVTHTGIAGLTLGGGIGWLMRKHGLTIDNLIAVEVVTAEGTVLQASEDENADLFWGVRGGGGNFGIVTSFEYRLHAVGPTVLAGPVFYPLTQAREVLRFYRDFVAAAPDELTTILNLRRAPAVPFLPEAVHGMPVIAVNVCYAGSIEEGERRLRPLRTFGSPLIDLIAPKPYLAHQSMFDETVPHGWHYYWKSWELPVLSDDVAEVLIAHAAAVTSPLSYCIIFQLGGAIGRVGEDDSAYSRRGMGHNVNINAVWMPNDPSPERHVRWAREFWSALEPFAPGGVYVNFLGDEGNDRVKAAYGPEKYDRMVALKNRYDPTNVFRFNQNIRPTGWSAVVDTTAL
jgi:FAD/FMN-containing dehydrogenase